ncbi:MAG: hypothetical protein JSW39_17470 [Desulfobacterales bacterium]|nr:MAG: hypothetical protein JSW39_17470 [Desulfobacterales bacterium]
MRTPTVDTLATRDNLPKLIKHPGAKTGGHPPILRISKQPSIAIFSSLNFTRIVEDQEVDESHQFSGMQNITVHRASVVRRRVNRVNVTKPN